ncbi:MAG TPA: succinate dehydrogenase, hydrophobic membrane anchor protein [Gammaproteobacteria bacterium]
MIRQLSGLRAWVVQRLSALYIGIVTPPLIWLLTSSWQQGEGAWRDLFAHSFASIALLLLFVAILFHAWVGMRDVILDYAGQWPGLRFILLVVLASWLLALGLWIIRVMLRVMLL